MAINKVQYGNTTLIDLTDTTAVASDVMQGKYFYGRDGVRVEGTNTGGSGDGYVWQDAQGYVHLSDEEGTLPTVDSLTVSASGTYTAPQGHVYNPVIVPGGTEGTPTATKGTVSSHSVTVTPSVTNSAGYISGGTHTGTGVSVSASELVSGTYNVSASGTADVTNYASISVPSGTAGTPSATKGAVSNHSVTVTPSVTNTTGYITGSTKTGTAVTVSASELVSGTLSITSSGTKDVTNYASASVASGSATASATKGAVSNHSVTVTPSVTTTAGYVTAGTSSGTAVTVSASELVSGSQTITTNDTYNVTNLAEVVVNVGGSGGLEYEEGTFVPAEDVAQPTIYFSDTHTTEPMMVSLQDASGTDATTNYFLFWTITNFSAIDQNIPQFSNGSVRTLARVAGQYMANDVAASNWQQSVSYTGNASIQYLGYWITSTWFRPYFNSATRYLKAGKSYKWMAVWAPTA